MITQIEKKDYADKLSRDPLTEKIIACCYRVHTELGPGFGENVYHNALKLSLGETGLTYETEKEFKVSYQGKKVGLLRIDLIVENKVIVEVKALATNSIPDLFKYQILSYLKISSLKTGLLVNFGSKSCQVKRFSNSL